ncbi:MAG TPA: DUF4336 domain-containing protein [Candidatus Binataceae bacterium]
MSAALASIAPNLWTAERPFKLPLMLGDIGTRMTIVKLADGGLFLHSPVPLDAETHAALDDFGPVRAIVAPSKAHHLFVGDYVKEYPGAKLYGAPELPEKRKDLKFDSTLSDTAPPEWQGQLEQHLFRGAPFLNEVVFFHAPTRTIIFTDLVFNVAVRDASRARVFNWLTGAAGHFGPHRLIRRAISNHQAARESVEKILQWNFERVIVTHGDVLETGGRERVRAAFSYL